MTLKIGETIRLKYGNRGYRVWHVTGIHLGGLGHEHLVSLQPLDVDPGSAYGKTIPESLVPLEMVEAIRERRAA